MDIADRADALVEHERDEGVRRAKDALEGRGSLYCVDCEDVIDAERARALPSARRCISCQEAHERAQRMLTL